MTDQIQRFIFTDHNIRGEIVRLDKSFETIIGQHHYPAQVANLLGETLLCAILMANTIKFRGQLTVQFQGDGPLDLLVAKCDHENNIRGLAQWQQDAIADEVIASMGDGELAVTIEQFDNVKPYQSIVPLENRTTAQALEHYFNLSEQLATRFWLAVGESQAVGLMLQAMPEQSPEEFAKIVRNANQAVSNEALLSHDHEDLLQALFKNDMRLYAPESVQFQCTCSLESMEDALKTFGEEEARDILSTSREVVVTCEYCNHEYAFTKEDVDRIFV